MAASLSGWDHPVSREWMLLASAYDVSIDLSGVKNPSRYHLPRPWRNAGRVKRKPRSMQELQEALKPWG